jgi:hypothetical protein
MSIIREQAAFSLDTARLIQYASGIGYFITWGEAWRPPEMTRIYVEQGKAQTMNDYHGKRLAVDFNFFKEMNGTLFLVQGRNSLKDLGDFWKALDKKNRWGGDYKSFDDSGHFERHV